MSDSPTTLIADAIIGRIASAIAPVPVFQLAASPSTTGLYVLCRVSVMGAFNGDIRRRVDVALDIYGRIDQIADVQGVGDSIDAALTGWTSSADGFLGPFQPCTLQPVPQDQVDPEQVRVTGSTNAAWVSLGKPN